MGYCERLNKKLSALYGGKVHASESDGCLRLTGILSDWDSIVAAGLLAVRPHRYAGLINDIQLAGGSPSPMHVPDISDQSIDGLCPDVLIVGGGIIGCAIARELARYRLSILLCEKEHDVAMHASSRNDGMVHPGIDLLPWQKKRRYNLRGNRMYDGITQELDVPFRRSGQYLCMRSRAHTVAAFLFQLYFPLVGIPVRFVGRKALREREPFLSSDIHSALFFPTAGTVCPYGLTIAYAENAADNGVHFSFDTAVLGMQVADGRIVSVETNRGTLHPRIVINAAGVFSDDVAEMAHDRFFTIHPRKGTNSILDKKAAYRVRTIASSFGTSSTKKRHTKGGGLVHTIDGNLLVGPDAHETNEKEDFSTNAQSIADTFGKHQATLPALSIRDTITSFSGIRAATYEEDFIITKGRRTENIIHAAGIQSPGLTAAPAIAEDVAKIAIKLLSASGSVAKNNAFDPIRKGIVRPRALSDEERAKLIEQDPDYGEIVCRCEEVSRGEIRDALRRCIPCDTLDGVKRRVRPGMGRCQGGFCSPAIVRMIAEERCIPPTQVQKSGCGSTMLLRETKQHPSSGE